MNRQALIGLIAVSALGACVAGQDGTQAVEQFAGFTAVSEHAPADYDHQLCDEGACILTRLSDTATGEVVATAVWSVDLAVGELIEAGRTSTITLEDQAGLTLAEANQATYGSAQIATADSSTSDNDLPYTVTCTSSTTNNGSCTCYNVMCFGCVPVEGGEYCIASSRTECFPTWTGYGGYCGRTRDV